MRALAISVHVGGGDPGVEGEAGQDRALGGRVEPLDVRGRVGLGVTQCLRLLERVGEAGPGGVHPVQDVVGGAIDDPQHLPYLVAGQRLAQRAQQRDRAAHGRLVIQVGAAVAGGLVQRGTVLGQQRLVGRDHRLAVLHGREQQRPRGLDPPDDLDHNVHAGPGGQLHGVAGEQGRGDVDAALPAGPAHGHPGYFQRGADPRLQAGRLPAEQPVHLGADSAAAQQRHLQRLHPGPSPRAALAVAVHLALTLRPAPAGRRRSPAAAGPWPSRR
jgi:hypothetical protein